VILFFFLLGVIDHAVLPAFRIGKVYPSFLYLFVCYASIKWETKKTLPVAFWAGLLKDLFGGGPLGVEAGILVAVAAVLDQIVRKVERNFPAIYIAIAFLFVLACETVKWMLAVFTGGAAGDVAAHLGSIAGMSLYTAVLFPPFEMAADLWFGKRFSSSRQYELFR